MGELKTKKNEGNVIEFLNNVESPTRKADSFTILNLIREITGLEPKMWGTSIVGFGDYHYKYQSGREGDWFKIGFSPRKQALTIYIMDGFDKYEDILKDLGKYKMGKGCLYIKQLKDIDRMKLKLFLKASFNNINNS